MRREHGRFINISTTETLERLLRRAHRMSGWRVQDLDLRPYGDALRRLDPAGAIFLGCDLDPATAGYLVAGGAVIFDDVPELPFNAYRTTLYTPHELYAGIEHGIASTPDAAIWAWSRQRNHDAARTMASAMHDQAIESALDAWVQGRRIVGIMGGHGVRRGGPEYANAARLGRALARAGFTVATGGGPGVMEAANLGAWSAPEPDGLLDDALGRLATVPDFAHDKDAWVRVALDVLRLAPGGESLGVPTWHYGHEPANVFATAIAKKFRNAVREDALLTISHAGIVVMPGAGGTVQEIFQDACENSYAVDGAWSPMVLVGTTYWTETMPAWQLLRAVMHGKPGEHGIRLLDDPDEIVSAIVTLDELASA